MSRKPTILSVEAFRTEAVRILSKHDPAQVDHVDELMKKWRGKEADLLQTLADKYKEPYTKMQPIGIKEQYTIGTKLGTGGFAEVRKCKDKKSNQTYALKIINKKNLDKDDLAVLDREVQIMRLVHHENIVKLHNVFDSPTKMCLVLDLLDGGELFDRIIEQGHFTEKNAAQCFGQLIVALDYLHQRKIVHRDLKPENLLFTKKCKNKDVYVSEEWNMKLIDFGLAGSCKYELLKTPCGTPNYVAPEILRKEKYGTSIDMWSAGVILYIILCGFPPFYDEHEDLTRLYRKIKTAEYDMPSPYWDNVSANAKDLVKKLLVPDPNKRLNAANALQHPWLQGKASDQKMSAEQVLQLKRFQYVRKLRRGVRCVLAVLRLIEALK